MWEINCVQKWKVFFCHENNISYIKNVIFFQLGSGTLKLNIEVCRSCDKTYQEHCTFVCVFRGGGGCNMQRVMKTNSLFVVFLVYWSSKWFSWHLLLMVSFTLLYCSPISVFCHIVILTCMQCYSIVLCSCKYIFIHSLNQLYHYDLRISIFPVNLFYYQEKSSNKTTCLVDDLICVVYIRSI